MKISAQIASRSKLLLHTRCMTKEPCQVESSWTTPSIFLLSSGATIKSNSFLEMACHTDQEKKMKFWKSWFFQLKIGHANFAHNSILELSNELLLVSCSVLLDAHAIFGLIWYTMGLGTSQICIFRSLMLPSSRSMGYRLSLIHIWRCRRRG